MVNEDQASWSYSPDGTATESADNPNSKKPAQANQSVSWTASEYIASQKTARWFIGYYIFLVALVCLIYLFTKDLISVIAVAFVGVLFSFLANKKPRQLAYEINNSGVIINGRLYPFGEFKSFSLSGEGVIGSINLIPLKRFMPEISIYFPPEQSDTIIDILVSQLPHEQRQEHSMDRLAKRFRF